MSNKKKKTSKNVPQKKQVQKDDYTSVIIFAVLIVIAAIIFCVSYFGNSEDPKSETPALDANKTYFADIVIQNYGSITVQLDQKSAPISAANFVKLAESGFYNGLTFHRIIEGFMMQGGAAKSQTEVPDPIVGEFLENGYNNTLKHERGVISMARTTEYNSASSQFFIVHETSPHLDGKYAAFGWVTEGMDVVDDICETAKPTDNNGSIATGAQPVITSITIRIEG